MTTVQCEVFSKQSVKAQNGATANIVIAQPIVEGECLGGQIRIDSTNSDLFDQFKVGDKFTVTINRPLAIAE